MVPQDLTQAALAGAPLPLVSAFLDGSAPRGPLLSRLLEAGEDGPVATCFAMIWREIAPDMPDAMLNLLRWYLHAEAARRQPTRAAVHRDVLARVLAWERIARTDAGFDLAFVAARVAVEIEAPLQRHILANRFLDRIGALWLATPGAEVRAPILLGAIATVNLSLLRRILDLARDRPRAPDVQHAFDWGLGLILTHQGIAPWLAGVIEREYAADPLGPAAVQRKAMLLQAEGRAFAEVVGLFHGMRADPAEPQQKSALQYGYWQALIHEMPDHAGRLAARIAALDPAWTPVDDGAPPGPTPLPEPPPEGSDLDRLARHAFVLAGVDLDLGTPATPAVLRRAFDRLAEAIRRAPAPAHWTLQSFTEVATNLRQLDLREFAWIAHFAEVPHAIGAPQYGSTDLDRIPVLHGGLMAVAAAFCTAGLDWLQAGHGLRGTIALARLAQLHTELCLQMDQPAQALAFLDRLDRDGLIADVLAIERDNCRLWAGDVTAASRDAPPSRAGSEVYPLMRRKDWTEAEGVLWAPLAEDAERRGRFGILWPDGREESFDHVAPAGRIGHVRLSGLSLIAEDLLIGPGGHMLRPDPYHTSLAYPRESRVVVAGQGRAVRVAPRGEAQEASPVLLLDGFEALQWHNYYHWMIPLLSRIALAQENGLLDRRRLVVPEGLRRWMTETLDLIGLSPDQRRPVPLGQRVRFDDAVLMTSVEHVSPSAIGALRRRIMGDGAKVKAPPADGPCLYLTRRDQTRRSLVNEAEIEALAREMGFRVIAPQDLTVAEQIVIFASARGVAAPEGAALTNTIFCAPGVRVLSIVCANDMMPIYNDLALVLGHDHLKLAGTPEARQTSGSRFQPQFSTDLALVRKALAWVQGA